MPHIIVKLYPGRSEEKKKNLVDNITSAVSKTLELDESTISIAIEEIPKEKWAKEVYKRDIIENGKQLYKKPGYRPAEEELI